MADWWDGRTQVHMSGDTLRVAMLSVHTSPLEQPGTGDAGGMNVYVTELSRALARRGAEVEIFTRATSSAQPDVVEVGDGILVQARHRRAVRGPRQERPARAALRLHRGRAARPRRARPRAGTTSSTRTTGCPARSGWLAADRWDVPLVHTMHTMARVKNAALAPGDAPEPAGRVIGEEQVVAVADALVANTAAGGRRPRRALRRRPGPGARGQPRGRPRDLAPHARRRGRRRARGRRARRARPARRPQGRAVRRPGPAAQGARRAGPGARRHGRPRRRPLPLLVVLGGASGRPTARARARGARLPGRAWPTTCCSARRCRGAELARWFRARRPRRRAVAQRVVRAGRGRGPGLRARPSSRPPSAACARRSRTASPACSCPTTTRDRGRRAARPAARRRAARARSAAAPGRGGPASAGTPPPSRCSRSTSAPRSASGPAALRPRLRRRLRSTGRSGPSALSPRCGRMDP